MCWLASVSRAGYYRSLTACEPIEEDLEVRAAIQEIVLAHRRRYGYRRVAAELRRRGMQINHKRVARLMQEDNLLAIQRRKYVITTDSEHDLEVYMNLGRRMKLTNANQLWIADLTYIRLKHEFVYLAVILDAWSRRVIGWALDRSLASRLAITALEGAIGRRQPPAGVVHHSDQGVQYACHDYVSILKIHKMTPSMSRPANPYDNATCESFMKTLKREEIHCREYRDLEDLDAHLVEFLDGYYNHQRLHSALGYLTPAEFEQQSGNKEDRDPSGAAKMSFSGIGNLSTRYLSRELVGNQASESPPHRLDEFPSGYSLARCSPAELASASPDATNSDESADILQYNFSKRETVFISRVSPEGFTPQIGVHRRESAAKASSKSPIKSPTSSTPTDNRTNVSEIPKAALCGGGTEA
jgi:transposase InsO family protein